MREHVCNISVSKPSSDKTRLQLLIELFWLNSTLNFEMPPVLVFQIKVYYKVHRLLTGLTAYQKGTAALGHSNQTFLLNLLHVQLFQISVN